MFTHQENFLAGSVRCGVERKDGIIGDEVAETSSGATGWIFESTEYDVVIDDTRVKL
jgi:hypothetical protein